MSTAITAAEKVDGFTRRSMRKAQKQKRSQGSSQFRSQSSQAELFPLPQLKGKFPATRGAAPRLAWGYRCRGGRVTFPGLSRVGGWWSPVVSFWRLLRAAITLGEKHFPRSFPPFNLLFCQRKKKGRQLFLSNALSDGVLPKHFVVFTCFENLALDTIKRSCLKVSAFSHFF